MSIEETPPFDPYTVGLGVSEVDHNENSAAETPVRPRAIFVETFRAFFLQVPRWDRIGTSPWLIASIIAIAILHNIVFTRLTIDGGARFYWQAIGWGWFDSALVAWLSYALVRNKHPNTPVMTDASRLFTLFFSLQLLAQIIFLPIFTVFVRFNWYAESMEASVSYGILLAFSSLWLCIAFVRLAWVTAGRTFSTIALSVSVVILLTALSASTGRVSYWYAQNPPSTEKESKSLELTQELMEAQPVLLQKNFDAILPERQGNIDLYTITFAPYGSEDVFLNESKVVNEVMATRFDAQDRGVRLINHVNTLEQYPWATPLNLQRSIQKIAQTMNKEEDIIFIHLTSHGASDGELSADFWPMTVGTIHPQDLRKWLDESGIKHRVISISACYAGNWIKPLATESTLVMTASDADHTSYGCGRKSELTFFGQAVYDEQLRTKTLSFEKAHAEAREVIKVRELKEGKKDGYSNPQIKVGAEIHDYLATFEKQLQERKD